MPDATARAQHKALARTTAARIRRMSAAVEDDLDHGRALSAGAAQQIVQAAITLLAEAVRLETRDEVAARRPAA